MSLEKENFIDLTVTSSSSELDSSSDGEDGDFDCPFNPPIIVSGNILTTRHYKILLSSSAWFTDDIINSFFCKLKESFPNSFVFSSYFYEALITKGQDYCLKHWLTGNFKAFIEITRPDSLVLFPVNSAGSHWVLVVWTLSTGELSYYDSLMCKKSGRVIMKQISNVINLCLDELELDKSLNSLSLSDQNDSDKISSFPSKIESFSIPKGQLQQSDGSSCGPFCCFYAKCLLEKTAKVTVDIYEFRKQLIEFFLNKQEN